MVSSVRWVSRVENSWPMCSSQSSLKVRWGIKKGPEHYSTLRPKRKQYLENDLQSELYVARLTVADTRCVAAVTRTIDQSIARTVADAACWAAQIQAVEDVENLHPELRSDSLGDGRVLKDGKVHCSETRAVELVALGVAES